MELKHNITYEYPFHKITDDDLTYAVKQSSVPMEAVKYIVAGLALEQWGSDGGENIIITTNEKHLTETDRYRAIFTFTIDRRPHDLQRHTDGDSSP